MDDLDRQILTLAGAHYRHQGIREQAMRDLGMSPVRFYQRLGVLLDSPTALAEQPALVRRLVRLRRARRAVRL